MSAAKAPALKRSRCKSPASGYLFLIFDARTPPRNQTRDPGNSLQLDALTSGLLNMDFDYLTSSPLRSGLIFEPVEGRSNSRQVNTLSAVNSSGKTAKYWFVLFHFLQVGAFHGVRWASLPYSACFALVPLRFCPPKWRPHCAGLRSLRTGWSAVTEGVNVEAASEDEGGDFGCLSSLTGINVRGSAVASSLACSLILSPRFRPMWFSPPPHV